MNVKFPSDTAEDATEEGSNVLDRVKEGIRENIIEPVTEAGKTVAGAARDGAAKVADYGRRAADSTDEWVGAHPYPTAGIAFLAGIVAGIFVGRQLR